MVEEGKRNPVQATQAAMRTLPVRRFYKSVKLREADGAHLLTLDGRAARTPGKNRLAAKSPAVMELIAEEWARQGEALDPADMPLTRLLNAAIDGVARAIEETKAEIIRYAGYDLLCYRTDGPEGLSERQRLAFDPLLAWADEAFGARFNLAAGVMHVAQPPETLAAVRAAVEAFDDPAALAALSAMTTLTGSALIALAVAHGRLGAAEAWRMAHVDEDWQNELWGLDEEAMARRAARWREMEAAALVASGFNSAS